MEAARGLPLDAGLGEAGEAAEAAGGVAFGG